jgi:hypothetical protein
MFQYGFITSPLYQQKANRTDIIYSLDFIGYIFL